MTIEVDNVTVTHNGIASVSGVSLTITAPSVTLVTGATGSGKSTLLRLLWADIIPTTGTVTINGTSTRKIRSAGLQTHRKTIGIVHQFSYLNSVLTAFQNVLMPCATHNNDAAKATATALELLALLGVSHCRTKLPGQLSGGERQLVAIARALIANPTLFIADEPLSMLDSRSAQRVLDVLNQRISAGMSMVVSSHNDALTRAFPNAAMVRLEEGRVMA